MQSVISPITGKSNTKRMGSIPVDYLSYHYKYSELKIDVERFFNGISHVDIYKCNDTGYRFYFPFDISGDAKFYEQLQLVQNYYPNDKWEFDTIEKIIHPNTKVLEIGCGSGVFLKKIKNKCEAIGLELNQSVEKVAIANNIDIRFESIQEHCDKYQNYYDLVCSFQVVEHISDVNSFMESSIKALRPGGTLVIAVPNNESYIYRRREGLAVNSNLQILTTILNSPPHHMGMWDATSLKKIAPLFNLQLKKILYEPVPAFRKSMLAEVVSMKFPGMLESIVNRLMYRYFDFLRSKFKGDTIIAIYTKTL